MSEAVFYNPRTNQLIYFEKLSSFVWQEHRKGKKPRKHKYLTSLGIHFVGVVKEWEPIFMMDQVMP